MAYLPTWSLAAAGTFFLYLFGAVFAYVVVLCGYRLVFSPLAEFPGPKLAGLTNWYEFYWDVIKQGQFTAHIQQLHKEHGECCPGCAASESSGSGSAPEARVTMTLAQPPC